MSLAGATAPAWAANTQTHVVETGDTLWDLAEAHDCTTTQLRDANGLERGDALVLGRTITIPACGGASALEPAGREHTVVVGDTLEEIAETYATTVADLRASNGIEGSLILIGQRLKLPRGPALEPGQSRGRVDDGSLSEPAQLPQSPAYYRRRMPRTYATAHLIEHTKRAVEAVHARYLTLHRLAIGDLSDEDGGPLEGHRTHQSGRDIDLGFYFVEQPEGYPEHFVEGQGDNLDVEATWARERRPV